MHPDGCKGLPSVEPDPCLFPLTNQYGVETAEDAVVVQSMDFKKKLEAVSHAYPSQLGPQTGGFRI